MPAFEMQIQDVFRMQDDQIVLVGPLVGETKYIRPGLYELHLDDQLQTVLRIEGEMMSSPERSPLRSVSTRDTKCLDRTALERGKWVLKPASKKYSGGNGMHRHLMGIESPPPNFIPDPMALGPVLPEGWDGDAWVTPDERQYFLRGWSKASGRIAYGRGTSYQEARANLLQDIAHGTRRAVVSVEDA